MRAYDSMGNEVTHTVASDFNGDGEIDRFQITTSTYDEQDNQTSKIFEEDFNADGQTDNFIQEEWEYDSNGNQTSYRYREENQVLLEIVSTYDLDGNQTSQYFFDENGDGVTDHGMEALVSYNDQGQFLSFEYFLDEGADGVIEESGTFHGRTYDADGNVTSLFVDYDVDGEPGLIVFYNSEGTIASIESQDPNEPRRDFTTPFPLEIEASDSSGLVFEANSSEYREFGDEGSPSVFKGYANGNLIVDTRYQTDALIFTEESGAYYSLNGQPDFSFYYQYNRSFLIEEDIDFEYGATGELERKVRSYREDFVDSTAQGDLTVGEEVTVYNSDEQVVSITDSGETTVLSSDISYFTYKAERLFSYDENGRIITETYSREEQVEENEVINPPAIVEAETKTWTYDDAFQLVSSTLKRDGDGDGDFDYQEIELHRSIFADTPTVDGKPATLFVNAANVVVGFGFQAGQLFNGELFSNTDSTVYPDDVILGTEGDDNIWAGTTGNDLIDAGNGNNTIGLGAGSSKVITGSGDDFIYSATATSSMNEVDLGQGDNTTWLTSGNYTIAAGSGDDEIGLGDGLNIASEPDGSK